MAKGCYTTEDILNWMGYFSSKMEVSPEKIKLFDICGKMKNVIPFVETHKRVLVFADETHEDLFYDFWIIFSFVVSIICFMIFGKQASASLICGTVQVQRKMDR